MSGKRLPAPTNHELEDYVIDLQAENAELRDRLEAVEDTSHISTFDIVGRLAGALGIIGSSICFIVFDVQQQMAEGDTRISETLGTIVACSIGIYLGASLGINGRRLIAKIRNI